MKKRIVTTVVVLLVIAAAVAGGWWAWVTYGEDSTEEDILGGSGTVEADEVAISSVIAAHITEVLVEEAAVVTSGTPLFQLNDELLSLQVDQAAAGLRAAEAALAQAQADGATPAEISSAQALIDQAKAAKAMAETQLGFASIEAPMGGTVTQVTARAGENASPGRTLATLSDLDTLYVSIYISETRIGEVKLGDTAIVTTDSSDEKFTGEVMFIATNAEFTPSNVETKEQRVKLVYEVRLSTEDVDGVLKPGMPVDVEF